MKESGYKQLDRPDVTLDLETYAERIVMINTLNGAVTLRQGEYYFYILYLTEDKSYAYCWINHKKKTYAVCADFSNLKFQIALVTFLIKDCYLYGCSDSALDRIRRCGIIIDVPVLNYFFTKLPPSMAFTAYEASEHLLHYLGVEVHNLNLDIETLRIKSINSFRNC